MSEWALAYALELVVTIPAGKVIWAKAKLAGALALPPLWVALSLYTTGRPGRLDRRVLAALLGLTVLMLMLLWTAAANGAVWRLAGPDAWVIVACSSRACSQLEPFTEDRVLSCCWRLWRHGPPTR